MDVDDFGDGGQSSPSSDEDSDVSGTVRFQGPRSRRKKMARQAGAASVATGVPIRKRGRKAQGQGQGTVGSGAVQDAVERERLDWPSTIIPRTPYNVPLLVSCLSTYPDKVGNVWQHPCQFCCLQRCRGGRQILGESVCLNGARLINALRAPSCVVMFDVFDSHVMVVIAG